MGTPVTFDEAYQRAGLPAADRDVWVSVLLRYPLDRERQRGFPTEDDVSAVYAELKADNREADHDQLHTRAWQVCVEREGVALLGPSDAFEVSGYVATGGTHTEATGYLDAVDAASSPDDDLWTVWARFELGFSTTRFGMYRRMGVSPSDLAAFVTAGWFTQAWDVQQAYRWGQQVCPDAPFLVAALYRGCGLSLAEIPVWEARRREGQDVVAALTFLADLAGNP